MTPGTQEKIGILPSLELLPFFDEDFMKAVGASYTAYASYGSIARDMLVGNLAGGVLPWEIFASEVLALPGQRNQWMIAFFTKPSPAELVLKTQIHKSIHAESGGGSKKTPAKLQIGIESRSSLTRHHFLKWLDTLNLNPKPEIVFKFLPMDQRLQGLPADALDGFIARSPWGLVAEERNLGTLEQDFSKSTLNQLLVTVCHKNLVTTHALSQPTTLVKLSTAREKLTVRSHLESAASRMDASGRPRIPFVFLAKAAKEHDIANSGNDIVANVARITAELQNLQTLSLLPPQIAATEQTAKLLAPG